MSNNLIDLFPELPEKFAKMIDEKVFPDKKDEVPKISVGSGKTETKKKKPKTDNNTKNKKIRKKDKK